MSRKQDMARTRNWNKMRILGMIANLKTIRNANVKGAPILYGYEKDYIEDAIDCLNSLLNSYDETTKHLIKQTK